MEDKERQDLIKDLYRAYYKSLPITFYPRVPGELMKTEPEILTPHCVIAFKVALSSLKTYGNTNS